MAFIFCLREGAENKKNMFGNRTCQAIFASRAVSEQRLIVALHYQNLAAAANKAWRATICFVQGALGISVSIQSFAIDQGSKPMLCMLAPTIICKAGVLVCSFPLGTINGLGHQSRFLPWPFCKTCSQQGLPTPCR